MEGTSSRPTAAPAGEIVRVAARGWLRADVGLARSRPFEVGGCTLIPRLYTVPNARGGASPRPFGTGRVPNARGGASPRPFVTCKSVRGPSVAAARPPHLGGGAPPPAAATSLPSTSEGTPEQSPPIPRARRPEGARPLGAARSGAPSAAEGAPTKAAGRARRGPTPALGPAGRPDRDAPPDRAAPHDRQGHAPEPADPRSCCAGDRARASAGAGAPMRVARVVHERLFVRQGLVAGQPAPALHNAVRRLVRGPAGHPGAACGRARVPRPRSS